jgi:plastocyanin
MTFNSLLVAGAVFASSTIANAADHVVTIANFKFSPANLTIAEGDSVIFVNKDGAPHTATASDGGFDTGKLGKNKKSKLNFPSAGAFAYFCQVHPGMKGKITVNK